MFNYIKAETILKIIFSVIVNNLFLNRVETQITPCNPHRTERAVLLHSAPHNIAFIPQIA